jgi:hypothetical protein
MLADNCRGIYGLDWFGEGYFGIAEAGVDASTTIITEALRSALLLDPPQIIRYRPTITIGGLVVANIVELELSRKAGEYWMSEIVAAGNVPAAYAATIGHAVEITLESGSSITFEWPSFFVSDRVVKLDKTLISGSSSWWSARSGILLDISMAGWAGTSAGTIVCSMKFEFSEQVGYRYQQVIIQYHNPLPADQMPSGESTSEIYTYLNPAIEGGQVVEQSFTNLAEYQAATNGISAAVSLMTGARVTIEAPLIPFFDVQYKCKVTENGITYTLVIDSIKHKVSAEGARTTIEGIVTA